MHEVLTLFFWLAFVAFVAFALFFFITDDNAAGEVAMLFALIAVISFVCMRITTPTPPRPDAYYCNRNNDCILITPTPTLEPTATEPR